MPSWKKYDTIYTAVRKGCGSASLLREKSKRTTNIFDGVTMDILKKLTEEFPIREDRAQNIINLIDEGNTIPFIARYRKEMTGSCDDQVLREFNDRLTYLRNLEQRKAEVAKSITEQEKMTEEIQKALDAASTLTEVEDIYRPYKQKKKTRASVAIERGLQPLADFILAQDKTADVKAEAVKYIDEEKGVPSAEAAINGADTPETAGFPDAPSPETESGENP